MWAGLGFVCPGAGEGPRGPYLLQSWNRWGVLSTLTAQSQRPQPDLLHPLTSHLGLLHNKLPLTFFFHIASITDPPNS